MLVWVLAAAVVALLVFVVLAAQRLDDRADADSCMESAYRMDKATRNALQAVWRMAARLG